MTMRKFGFSAVLCLALAIPASAANRAFVSGSGLDTGTCLITSPCRSFAYALTQITSGGEVIALDTAGYGSMTVSQSASIIAPTGITAFSTASSGFVVVVAAGPSDTVTLHGITVSGNGTTTGVAFNSGQTLNIESCIVTGHSEGIVFDRSSDSSSPQMQIINSIVRNNIVGLDVSNAPIIIGAKTRLKTEAVVAPPSLIYVTVKDTAFLANATGLYTHDNSHATVSNSVFAGNSNAGVIAVGSDSAASEVSLDGCTLSRNGTGVIAGDQSGSQLRHGVVMLANCQITGNDTGISTTASGATLTRISNNVVTNTIFGNSVDGVPSGTYIAQ